MEILPSGLPSRIVDEEDTARFLASSSLYNLIGVKAAAFMPNPKDRETSVFRHGPEPIEQLWALGKEALQGRTLHGAAIVKASIIREMMLTLNADEPPPRHAAIRGWPVVEEDPELQKALQKQKAEFIASKADLFRPQ